MSQSGFFSWVGTMATTHTRRLAAVARAEGLTAEDALDAVQEGFHTLLSMPQARSLVGNEDDCAKLLSVIVRNAARNMRRRHHRARPHVEMSMNESYVDQPSVESMIERAEEHVRLLGCINQLGTLQRHVVSLRMLEELSGEDTAHELELTSSHVAVLLHRAKRELQRCLLE